MSSTTLPLQGQVFAVTGGASGIGLATAKLLHRRGGTVYIADIDDAAIAAAEEYFNGSSTNGHVEEKNKSNGNGPVQNGCSNGTETTSTTGKVKITKVDVSRRAEVDAWIDSIVAETGRLDGAANVAGVIGNCHGITPVTEMEDDQWDRIIGVNLTGMMYCLRAELRVMRNGGSVVNVSSIHGLKGFARHAAYDASKHGVIGLTKAAAMECGDREIRVNSVAPGSIYTPLIQKEWDAKGRPKDAPFSEPTAFRRLGTAEETANVIAFLLGPESTFVSGSVYSVDGAWN